MQSFLLPLSGGNTSGPPTPLRTAKESEPATAELLAGTPPSEFGDVFAADALVVAAEDVVDQIVQPPAGEEVEAPELVAAEGEDVFKTKGVETEETTFLSAPPLPLKTARSDQIIAKTPKIPEMTVQTNDSALPKEAVVSAEATRLPVQSVSAPAVQQTSTSLASSVALQAATAIPKKPNLHQQTPQAPSAANSRVAPVLPQPAEPPTASAPAQILAAIAQRHETAPPPPALPKQPSQATSAGVPPTQIVPLVITKPPANVQQDTLEKASTALLEPFGLGRSDGPAAPQSTTAPAAARADLAGHVARQIADVAHHMPARPVEITLSPEELGRVRLSVSTHESGIVLNIVAERPETVDLLRRHIGQLGQEFQSLGYESIAFSFSGGGDAQTSDHKGDDAASGAAPMDDPDIPPLQIALATGTSAGVDLRL